MVDHRYLTYATAAIHHHLSPSSSSTWVIEILSIRPLVLSIVICDFVTPFSDNSAMKAGKKAPEDRCVRSRIMQRGLSFLFILFPVLLIIVHIKALESSRRRLSLLHIMTWSLASFLGGISAAIVVKLTSSIDDVLWLSAFLTPSQKQRARNAITYTAVCLLQTCFAYMLSTFGKVEMERLVGHNDDDDSGMSPERILTLVAGSALAVYAVVLGVEYYKEHYKHEEKKEYMSVETADTASDSEDSILESEEAEEESQSDGSADEMSDDDVTMTDDQDLEVAHVTPLEMENEEERSDKKSRSLAVICFLGSLDDLTLFVPMLVGKTFGFFELVIGALISTLTIIAICVSLTRCKLVADALEKVPLVAIVTGFCLVLLAKGIFFMD